MRFMLLPKNQIYHFSVTGKFKALNSEWTHMQVPLWDYELIVMTEGTLYISYENEKFEVREGQYLLLPPSSGIRQGYRKSYCSFYWMHFSTDQGRLPLTRTADPRKQRSLYTDDSEHFEFPQQGSLPVLSRMVVLMKQLQDMEKNAYPSFSIDAMTTAIMTELYGQLKGDASAVRTPADRKQVYQDLLDYIQDNLSRNIKIQEMADQFGYNPKYLSHLFAGLRGMPLKQYILSQKVDAASFMLRDSDAPISEIASSLGFSDVHNFSRAYKKLTGLSPSEYRNAYAGRVLNHE